MIEPDEALPADRRPRREEHAPALAVGLGRRGRRLILRPQIVEPGVQVWMLERRGEDLALALEVLRDHVVVDEPRDPPAAQDRMRRHRAARSAEPPSLLIVLLGPRRGFAV